MSRGVRGPNSALTEFLREKGINANEIRQRAEQRAQAAADAAAAAADGGSGSANSASATPAPAQATRSRRRQPVPPTLGESSSAAAARVTVTTTSTVAVGRTKKTAKKTKRKKKDDSDDDSADEGFNFYHKSIPTPGQIAFCFECESRFTVTTYTKASEDGDGLLCAACGRKSAKQDKAAQKLQYKAKRTKRNNLRSALDGEAPGARSLKEYCIKYVANHIQDVEELGDLESSIMDKICQILCRNRSLDNSTLKLFTVPQNNYLTLYDCARIDADNLCSVASFMPNLKHLSLIHAGRMNDDILTYYGEKLHHLTSFHINGAFLVSYKAYSDFFATVGKRLTSLTISGARNNEAMIEDIVNSCPNLTSLNLSSLTRLDDACIRHLARLTKLTHLDISYSMQEITDDAIVHVLNSIGSGLIELNLAGNHLLTGVTTSAIHACCAALRHLNLHELELLEDADISSLFTNWTKNRGLFKLNLSHVVNLTDVGLLAIASHSGGTLEEVDLNSCAFITKEGVMAALGYCKKLGKVDVGFIRGVDDDVVEALQEKGARRLALWGCRRVTQCAKPKPGVSMVGRESDIAA